MNLFFDRSNRPTRAAATPWALLLAAGILIISMLTCYVQLLQAQVARGEEMRAAWPRTTPSRPPAKMPADGRVEPDPGTRVASRCCEDPSRPDGSPVRGARA